MFKKFAFAALATVAVASTASADQEIYNKSYKAVSQPMAKESIALDNFIPTEDKIYNWRVEEGLKVSSNQVQKSMGKNYNSRVYAN